MPVPPFPTANAVPDQLELLIEFKVAKVPNPAMSVFFSPREEVAIKLNDVPLEKARVEEAPIPMAVWKYEGL